MAGQQDPIITQTAQDLLTTAQAIETLEDQLEGSLDLLVWLFDNLAIGQANQASR